MLVGRHLTWCCECGAATYGPALAYGLSNLGNCYAVLGQTHRATELADQALTLARQTGDQQCEANVLANLGNYHATLGRTQQATCTTKP